MAKPTDDMSDQRLRDGLKTGEFEGRNELIAEEILRRRTEDRVRSGRLGIIGALATAAWLWFRRRFRRS
jgi:hypothetical protein